MMCIVLNVLFRASLKQPTATLRQGVFARLMNQRCVQQPNRCCFPPVSREMPTVSCMGHLAPWCLSLFIVRGFPITRAGRGHFLSALSTEKCVHNAWCCHRACKAQSGPCTVWSRLDSWAKAPKKEWEIECKSLERKRVWMLIRNWAIGSGCHVDIQSSQTWGFYIIGLHSLRERFLKKACKIIFFLVVGYLKSGKCQPVLSPQLHSAAEQQAFTAKCAAIIYLILFHKTSRRAVSMEGKWSDGREGKIDRQNESISSLTESSCGNM